MSCENLDLLSLSKDELIKHQSDHAAKLTRAESEDFLMNMVIFNVPFRMVPLSSSTTHREQILKIHEVLES